jgi:hypothetical protein
VIACDHFDTEEGNQLIHGHDIIGHVRRFCETGFKFLFGF